MYTLQQKGIEIQNLMKRVYAILEMTPEESEKTLQSLGELQMMSMMRVLLESITKDEANELAGKLEGADESQKKMIMEEMVSRRKDDKEFVGKVEAALKKVFGGHIIVLRNCGDEVQKREVAKILSEIGF
jgi:hypothetical protein